MVSAGSAWRFGSSPLARGKHRRRRADGHARRLIPARAGKTRTSPALTRREQAHPRSRGENWRAGLRHIYCPGSSPLARGKQSPRYARGRRIGLIPARAGKTSGSRATAVRRAAHPRSRGENFPACLRRKSSCGSSPLARGKRVRAGRRRGRGRLIPARAGKTGYRRRTWGRAPAHPRSRGENLMVTTPPRMQIGSSPLARGKRFASA